jgi:hypothetical protein
MHVLQMQCVVLTAEQTEYDWYATAAHVMYGVQ